MAYTAIVLDEDSAKGIVEIARSLGLFADLKNPVTFAHHVTLAIGDHSARWTVGTPRVLKVVKVGWISCRVCAFMVEGASDSANSVQHITIAAAEGVKPFESNKIGFWHTLSVPFEIRGTIQVCK